MEMIHTRNGSSICLRDIPILDDRAFQIVMTYLCSNSYRPIALFGNPESGSIRVYTALENPDNSEIALVSRVFQANDHYESLTPVIPAMGLFERELMEEFGIHPDGHPWLKPVRYPHNAGTSNQQIKDYPFFHMSGEEVHEVAVGPVHAGVIEPGHFRFQCHGEDVYHLEIQLGYQHRGIEKLIEANSQTGKEHRNLRLAESIAGDSVIGHTSAYCQALEGLSGIEIPMKAQAIRAIAQEMERAAMHLSTLSGIANDIAYLPGNSVYGTTRTLVINAFLSFCGNRFGRGLLKSGGVCHDIPEERAGSILKILDKVIQDTESISEAFFASPGVLSRLEHTGKISKDTARTIGMVGTTARASHLETDVRVDYPYGMYRYYPLNKISLPSGDTFARSYLRYMEIRQSINFIREQLDNLPAGNLETPLPQLRPDSIVISLTEGHRGRIVHCGLTDFNGRINRYKIIDPSFHNWMGLALAVRNNEIADFPLCNKSFDLSYCGHDL